MAAPQTLFATQALLPDGWAENVRLVITADGRFGDVQPGGSADGALRLAGPALPGMVNLHSHAFQRAMAGLTEQTTSGGEDNFWTWREVMYRFLAKLDPDAVEHIATWLYIELLRAGYTSVVEFHYLHHAPDGSRYSDRAELSVRMLRAAARAGIAITLLPVHYAHGGFGGSAPTAGQRRFIHDGDSYARLLEDLAARLPAWPLARLGVAPHSLRAVTPDELHADLALAGRLGKDTPIHLHAAEQEAEVAASQAALGLPPIAWLLRNVAVDQRFCLIHATQMTADESAGLACSGAVVGLCPSSEANLGDGLFIGQPYLQAGGRFGIGSDSNVGIDPFDELRLLEYGQRLQKKRRNILCPGDSAQPSIGGGLFRAALLGGAQAAGQPTSRLAAFARADLVVLDGDAPTLYGKTGDALLDGAIFGPERQLVRDVMVGGRFVVKDRQHAAAEPSLHAYRQTLRQLR
jgi:formimidoylglutamate deiminase